jgi:cholesterol transport system auxiliary component
MNSRTKRAPCAPLTFAAAALAATLLVAGCSLSRPSPVKQSYLVEPAPPPAVATSQAASLRVGTINVAAPFRGRSFVVREGELRYETDFYSEFLVAPAPMLGEATARALGDARVFARVVAPGAPPDADYVLDGFVSALYEDLRNPAAPAADIVVTYYLARADNLVPFWSKEYRQHVPLTAASPSAYAAGLSTAFGAIMAELARDLAAVDLAKR